MSAGAHAEGRLLRYVPTTRLSSLHPFLTYPCRKRSYYHSEPPQSLAEVSNQPVIAYSSEIIFNNRKHHINTLSITSTSPCNSSPAPVVLLHGSDAGLGSFKNFSTLGEWAASHRSSVYTIAWLGMGWSTSVPFIVNAKRDDIPGRVCEAEAFFVDSRRVVGEDEVGEDDFHGPFPQGIREHGLRAEVPNESLKTCVAVTCWSSERSSSASLLRTKSTCS